jgi:serine kinase of HPr protein (carbohydrate metabolism regulator)
MTLKNKLFPLLCLLAFPFVVFSSDLDEAKQLLKYSKYQKALIHFKLVKM